MNTPHGGKLVDKVIKKNVLDLTSVDLKVLLTGDQVSEVKNIATGVYSPLIGFMNEDDFRSVVEKSTLCNGLPWTVPIFLPLNKKDWKKLKRGSQILLQYKLKEKIIDFALLKVEDLYIFDQEQYVQSVYGTTNPKHPGVTMIRSWSDHVVGGEIWLFGKIPVTYPQYELTPQETRALFAQKGWNTIAGFQTRNAPHRAHEFIQKLCLEFVDGLFVNPIIGSKKSGDFRDDVILAAYQLLVKDFYPSNSTALGVYSSRMNYAGPKEAIFHAIVRKNFGCTHFIVGRDHAGVGDFYDKLAAHRIFDEFENIGIIPMRVSNAFFDKKVDMYTTQKTSPFGPEHWIAPSGTEVRRLIKEKNYEGLKFILRKEVLDEILKFDEPFVN